MKISTKVKFISFIIFMFLMLNITGTVVLVHQMIKSLEHLVEIDSLLEKSIFEMEINSYKTVCAVNYHVYNPQESRVGEIKNYERIFEYYAKKYQWLVKSDENLALSGEGVILGNKVMELYSKLKMLGDEIISVSDRTDKADKQLEQFKQYHLNINSILNNRIKPIIKREIIHTKKNTINSGKIVIAFILISGLFSFVLLGAVSWLVTKSVIHHRQAEKERKKLLYKIGERVKELKCMYDMGESIRTRVTLEEIFQDVVEFIPRSWSYPEITQCKISFDNSIYVAEPFEESRWKISCNIIVNGKMRGLIAVYYLEERPELDDGPFLKEERKLLDSIGARLGHITELKHAEQERILHLRFLKNITKIDQVIQQNDDIEMMMSDVLQTTLDIFECDRAWLLYPCDPNAEFWTIPMECTRPEYPGGFAHGKNFPMTLEMQKAFQTYLQDRDVDVVDYRKDNTPQNIAADYSIKSEMNIPIFPRLHKPWVFGIHMCSHYRVWTEEEQDLFSKIGHRITDALSSMLFMRDLHRSEKRFKGIFNSNRDGYAIVMGKGEILDANPRMIEMLGYSKDELKIKGFWEIVPEKWYKYKHNVQGSLLFERGHTDLYEREYVQKDGVILPVEVQAFILKKGDGFKSTMFGVFIRDITERKRSQEAVLKSEQRFRNLIENSPTGIIIIRKNKIVYRNSINKNLVGVSENLSLSNYLENIHQNDIEKIKHDYQKLVSGEKKYIDMEFRFYPAGKNVDNSDMKWFHCTASVIDYHGKKAVLLNLMDVTITKRLNHMLRIQDKMISLGRVAAGIAHEIRNPLSGINIYLNTLQKITSSYENPEKTDKILSQLQSASNKIESVIKRVMDFARPAETKFALIDLNSSIIDAVNLTSVTLRKSGIQFSTLLADNLPKCHADSHMIEQVIVNLIANASEAMQNMDRGKKINISSFLENNTICISVSDSGEGVGNDIRNEIFEPFYTTKSSGSGIGLSICQRIITDHGGTLELSTVKTAGAEFIIKLPITAMGRSGL